MVKRGRWELKRENGVLRLYRGGKLVAEGIEEILDIIKKCPKCGQPAVSAYVSGLGYIYAWHLADNGKKHAWYIGPAKEPWLEILEVLRRKEITLTKRDREILYKVYVKKVKATPEERRRAREILELVLRASKVVVYA
ncbi:MAG: hypothetical protein DRJ67_01635 [Thermoprotei archaeon]|nr:MAG: hypothetical protein DRJ67_01635 [Thermoprotei archaeon]